MIASESWTVSAEDPARRLDAAVRARHPAAPAARVREAIVSGRILLNGQPAPKGRRVRAGDRIEVVRLLEAGDPFVVPEPALPLAVVAVDADWLALDKPAGMPAHPLTPDGRGTLANALAARYPECAGIGDPPAMGGILHRLDAGTSGLTLAARTAFAFDALRSQFMRREVEKVYEAWVEGAVDAPGRIRSWLAHTPGDRGRMRSLDAPDMARGERAMEAVTAYVPVERRGDRTRLRVTIFSGVTHQIRCQLAAAGHPVAGDAVYGSRGDPPASRHCLHAARISFRHPRSGNPVTIECPPRADFNPRD